MAYDAASMLTETRRFSNLAGTQGVANTLYSYDCGGCAGRVTAIRHRKASDNSVIHDMSFTRDPLGNITQMTDAEGIHSYTYDAIRRLRTATHQSTALQPNEFYTYDAAGNRLTSHLSHVYSYSYQSAGKGHRLLQDNQFDYTYDDEGNQITRTDRVTGSRTVTSYNYRNLAIGSIQSTGTGIVTASSAYSYDALGRRINVVDDGQNVYFVYDALNPTLKLTSGSLVINRRAYSRSLDSVLADETEGQSRWLLTDQVGTVRDIVGNSGTVLTRFTYNSSGQLLHRSNSAIQNELLFNGREFSLSSGIGYFRARLYDPAIARFTSEDPIEPFGYLGLLANPLSFTDRLGLIALVDNNLLQRHVASQNVATVAVVGNSTEIAVAGIVANQVIAGTSGAITYVACQRSGYSDNTCAIMAAGTYLSAVGPGPSPQGLATFFVSILGLMTSLGLIH